MKYVAALQARGYHVELVNPTTLRISPRMPDYLRAQVRQFKEQIIAELLYLNKPYWLINSRLLGEIIAVGSDWPHDKYVGYTWSECEQMLGCSPDLIKRIHQIKRKFPGACVSAGKDSVWWPELMTSTDAQLTR